MANFNKKYCKCKAKNCYSRPKNSSFIWAQLFILKKNLWDVSRICTDPDQIRIQKFHFGSEPTDPIKKVAEPTMTGTEKSWPDPSLVEDRETSQDLGRKKTYISRFRVDKLTSSVKICRGHKKIEEFCNRNVTPISIRDGSGQDFLVPDHGRFGDYSVRIGSIPIPSNIFGSGSDRIESGSIF